MLPSHLWQRWDRKALMRISPIVPPNQPNEMEDNGLSPTEHKTAAGIQAISDKQNSRQY